MALTNSVKGDEIEKTDNEVGTEKATKAVQEPIRSRTSQRKAATAAVNAMKEQAAGARKADNDDDEVKPKRGGRGRPKANNTEKTSAKNERKRALSSDGEEDDQPKGKRGRPKGKTAPKKKPAPSGRKAGRPSKASKEEAAKESEENKDLKAGDAADDESNSGEENAKSE